MNAVAAIPMMAATPPMLKIDAIQRLHAELLASPTATAVLERRCALLGLADPPCVHAEVIRGTSRADARTAERLDVGEGTRLGYRRVRLMCGASTLSEATNRYVPHRLTGAMNAVLDGGDVPFGRVILPLEPRRRTISTWRARGPIPNDGVIVRHRAIVLDGEGRPLAEVEERYQRVLID